MKCLSPDALIAVDSIIAGFGVTAVMFRLQRELSISDENWKERRKNPSHLFTPNWIPVADYLIIAAVLLALIFAVRPLLMPFDEATLQCARAASAAATILLGGYVPTILGHYGFIRGLAKSRPYCTIWEGLFAATTILSAIWAYHAVYVARPLCAIN
jgi:hypothetical protein